MSYNTWGRSWGVNSAWGTSWNRAQPAGTPGVFFGGQFFAGGFFGDATVTPTTQPSGGFPASDGAQRRTRKDISRDRERFGIPDEARLAIEAVAAQQSQRLEQDKQKQFEELNRELELRGIEFEGRYLESLNVERERLINAEIGLRLRQRMIEDEELMILVMMAAVA